MKHGKRADARDPEHRRRGVADNAASPAGVGRGDNRCEVTDADAALEDMPCDGRADERRGDIVEERGDNEHENQKHETPGPIVR